MNDPLQKKHLDAAASTEYFDLLDLLIVFAKHKRKLLLAPLVAGAVIYGVSLVMPNYYTGSLRILPPQSQSGAAALLGQLGALGGLAGGALGGKTTNETYIGMLTSRTVSDSLIDRFKLQQVYKTEVRSDTRHELKAATTITNGRDGIILVEVEDKDPVRAAALANGYASALQEMTLTLAVTEAAQRRLFFDKQLEQAKKALNASEFALKAVQEKTGLLKLDGQAQGIIAAAASLKATVTAKEVALSVMRTFAAPGNPEYMRAQQELASLRQQLAKMETAPNQGNGDISVATSKVPEVGMEYVRRVRDVKYNEALFEALAKQLELAKIDEAKDSSTLQVLDNAVTPDKKSSPRRALLVLVSAAVAFVLAMGWAIIAEMLANAKKNESQREQLRLLRQYMSRKKSGAV
jgi:tyrosine-protein kinase Etk/Wzc